MDWVQEQIDDINYWLHINEKQSTLPTMDIEDELHKQEVRNKKNTLALLERFKHHPMNNPTPKTDYPKTL